MKWIWANLRASFLYLCEVLTEPETAGQGREREVYGDVDLGAEVHKHRAGSARRGD